MCFWPRDWACIFVSLFTITDTQNVRVEAILEPIWPNSVNYVWGHWDLQRARASYREKSMSPKSQFFWISASIGLWLGNWKLSVCVRMCVCFVFIIILEISQMFMVLSSAYISWLQTCVKSWIRSLIPRLDIFIIT